MSISLDDLRYIAEIVSSSCDLTLNHSSEAVLEWPEKELYRYPFRKDHPEEREQALKIRTIYKTLVKLIEEIEKLGTTYTQITVLNLNRDFYDKVAEE